MNKLNNLVDKVRNNELFVFLKDRIYEIIIIMIMLSFVILFSVLLVTRIFFPDDIQVKVECEVRISETYQEIPDNLFPDNCSKRVLIIESK